MPRTAEISLFFALISAAPALSDSLHTVDASGFPGLTISLEHLSYPKREQLIKTMEMEFKLLDSLVAFFLGPNASGLHPTHLRNP